MRPGFRTWSVAAALSTLGDSVTYFALGWAAAAHGPGTASLVLTLESVPLCVLVLAGGVLADKHGIRRTMLGCDLAMVVVTAAFLVHALGGSAVLGLCLLAVAAGTAAALRRPADGAFARLFVEDDHLPRAMAQVSLLQQVARTSGPAVGGVLLGLGGLPLVAGVDLVSYLLVAAVLVGVRPPRTQAPPVRETAWGGIARSVRAASAAGVVPVLGATTLLAASVLTTVILGVPLAGQDRGWGAAATGVVVGCWTVGTSAVTAVVSRRGAPGGWSRVAGPAVGAAGIAVLAVAPDPWLGAVAMLLLGVGTATYTCTVLPLFVRASPPDLVGRFQALLGLAQNAAVLVALPTVGWTAARAGPGAALAALSVLLLATVLLRWPEPAPDSGACPPTASAKASATTATATTSPSSAPASSGSGSGSPG